MVRRSAPILRRALWIAAALVAAFVLYVVYELGRYNAGYDRQEAAQERTELRVQIEHLDKSNRELSTQLAELDTVRLGRSREQAEVSRTIHDLQAQVAKQSQELAFLRGVVAQNATALGVKIDQLRITPGPHPSSYLVHLSLVRSGKAEADVTGSILLTVDGTSYDGPKSLELPIMTGGHVRELRYNFRYLENIEQEIALPLALKPTQVTVEISSAKKDIAPLSQRFPWSVQSSP